MNKSRYNIFHNREKSTVIDVDNQKTGLFKLYWVCFYDIVPINFN